MSMVTENIPLLCVTSLVLPVQDAGVVRLSVASNSTLVRETGQLRASPSPSAVLRMVGAGGADGGGGGVTVKATSK